MTDYYKELTAPASEPQGHRASGPPADWYKDLTGGAEVRSMPPGTRMPSRDAPAIADTPTGAASLSAQFKSGWSPDTQKQIKIFANSLGIPESRFGVIEGNIVYAGDDGQIHRATPSVTGATGPLDALMRGAKWLGSQIGPSFPGAAGTVAGVATSGSGPGSVAAATGAAGAADVVRQAIGNYLSGSPVSDIDTWNAVGQAALGGAGQAGGAIINRALQRNPLGISALDRIEARSPSTISEAQLIADEARKRGINLSAGQQTGLKSLQVQERQLGRYPETQDRMADFVEQQRTVQVPRAINAEADRIARNSGGENAIESFRSGADVVVKSALDKRSAEARIAYGRALDDRTDRFWNEPLESLLSRPSGQEGLAYAKLIAAEEGKDITVPVFDKGKIVGRDVVPDWRSWDYIKRGIDRVIEKNTDELGRVNAYGRTVVNTKKQMMGILDKANTDYARARAMYGDASEAVDAVLDGGVGLLKKMQGPERQAMVERIFGARALMPEEVGRMRGMFVDAGQVDAWNQGVRQYIAGKLDTAMKTENVPQAFYKAMEKDPAQRAVLRAALGDTARIEGWENLMKVLDRARKGLPEGSPTATDLPAMLGPQTTGPLLRAAGAAASPNTYLNAGNAIVGALDRLRSPAARVKLADALLSPNAADDLRKMRMLAPNSERAVLIASRILAGAGLTQTGATDRPDQPIGGDPVAPR